MGSLVVVEAQGGAPVRAANHQQHPSDDGVRVSFGWTLWSSTANLEDDWPRGWSCQDDMQRIMHNPVPTNSGLALLTVEEDYRWCG